VSLLMPLDCAEFMGYFLCLFVVDADDVVLACGGEGGAGGGVVERHDEVVLFDAVPDLLACFCGELVEVAAGVGDQQDGGGAAVVLVEGAPAEGVDRTGLANSSVDLCDLVVGAEVEHPHEPV
jgi:hypothetical protein